MTAKITSLKETCQLRRYRCSFYGVIHNPVSEDVCIFYIGIKPEGDGFRFEIYIEKDGEAISPDDFSHSFPPLLPGNDQTGRQNEMRASLRPSLIHFDSGSLNKNVFSASAVASFVLSARYPFITTSPVFVFSVKS